jgi:toxin-antitoxin system PIN domain toxin
MKLVDTNVLLYVSNPEAEHHSAAKRWLDGALAGRAPVGFAWLTLVGFVRIVSNPRIFDGAIAPSRAMDQVDHWLAARSATILQPGARHASLMRQLLDAVGSGGNLVPDAHLAALALEHRATMVSFDTDFGRFPGVRWETPR